jgi:cell wall-associated NlpC family hydrolase
MYNVKPIKILLLPVGNSHRHVSYLCFMISRLFVLIILFAFNVRGQNIELGDSIVTFAKEQLGVPYKYATCDPNNSFDCSGFVSYVYDNFNLPNSRSSRAYGNLGKVVALSDAQPGDCILFTGTDPSVKRIGHVGIVVENEGDELRFIHCSSSKKHFGVVITEYYSSGYPKRFVEVRRIKP